MQSLTKKKEIKEWLHNNSSSCKEPVSQQLKKEIISSRRVEDHDNPSLCDLKKKIKFDKTLQIATPTQISFDCVNLGGELLQSNPYLQNKNIYY